MRRLIWLAALAALLAGCAPKETSSTGVSAGPPPEPAPGQTPADNPNAEPPKPSAKDTVPAELKTAGYQYLGLDNPAELRYEQTVSGRDPEPGTQKTTFVGMKEGKAEFKVERTGSFAVVGDSEMYAGQDGVFTTSVHGQKLAKASMEVPADLAPGKSWTSKTTFSVDLNGSNQKVAQDMRYTAIKVEPVQVKAGKFDAMRIAASGTIAIGDTKSMTTTTIWFAKGVGLVKMSSVADQGGVKQTSTVELVSQ